MALDWNLTQIPNHIQTCWIETGETDRDGKPQRRMAAVTEALIYNGIAIGIGVITADNAGEVYARTKVREALKGCLLTAGGQDVPITIEDIQAHVGLSTNVPYESREKWAQRLLIGNGDYLTPDGTKLNKDALEADQNDWDIQPDRSVTEEHRSRYEEQVAETDSPRTKR